MENNNVIKEMLEKQVNWKTEGFKLRVRKDGEIYEVAQCRRGSYPEFFTRVGEVVTDNAGYTVILGDNVSANYDTYVWIYNEKMEDVESLAMDAYKGKDYPVVNEAGEDAGFTLYDFCQYVLSDKDSASGEGNPLFGAAAVYG